MEIFSPLLALCAGNSPVCGEIPAQRPVTRSFGVFFDLRLNKRLSKQSWGWWFETPSRPLWRQSNGVLCSILSSCMSELVVPLFLSIASYRSQVEVFLYIHYQAFIGLKRLYNPPVIYCNAFNVQYDHTQYNRYEHNGYFILVDFHYIRPSRDTFVCILSWKELYDCKVRVIFSSAIKCPNSNVIVCYILAISNSLPAHIHHARAEYSASSYGKSYFNRVFFLPCPLLVCALYIIVKISTFTTIILKCFHIFMFSRCIVLPNGSKSLGAGM